MPDAPGERADVHRLGDDRAHLLRAALDLFSVPKLQDAARRVIARNPHTKPSNMRSKLALVDYIARYVRP